MDEDSNESLIAKLQIQLAEDERKRQAYIKKIENSYGSLQNYRDMLMKTDLHSLYPYMPRRDIEKIMEENNKYL